MDRSKIRQFLQYQVSIMSDEIASLKKHALENGGPMSPKSKDWGAYKARKAECSMFLTMLSLIKRNADQTPSKPEAVKLFHAHKFCNHARSGQRAKNLFFKAFRRLQKIDSQINCHLRENNEGMAAWLAAKRIRLEAQHAAKTL